jgi:hypothetical protein
VWVGLSPPRLLPCLVGCAQQVCQTFQLVWFWKATRTLHNELTVGIVLCSPPGCNSGFSGIKWQHNKTSIEWRCFLILPKLQTVPRVRCGRITSPHLLSWPCVSDFLYWSIRRELLRAVTLDDSTPQCRISELWVWSYEPFIVPVSSSSGYTSGQNLEVLYIIRNSIWNIFKIIQKIIKKYEIVLKQQLDTVSYLEEQKISAGLHPE